MSAEKKPIVGVVGLGRFGRSLVYSLRQIGHQVETRGAHDRRRIPLKRWATPCQVLCLAVRDDQIEDTVSEMVALDLERKTVLIHAGIVPLTVLDPLKQRGAVTGKFHPLQAFSLPRDEPIPRGTPFAIEGDVALLTQPWVKAWSCSLHHLSGDQWLLYHAAAVMASNFLPLFIRAGAHLLKPLAGDVPNALAWLAPLVQRSVAAALDHQNPQPYSGPAVRRDDNTLAIHRAIIEQHHPQWLDLYLHASDLLATAGETAQSDDSRT